MENNFTIELISKALDAAMLRQTAFAFNISHANSENATAQRVQFEQQLQTAESVEDLQTIKPQVENTLEPIKIDREMALSLQNTTQYRALAKGISKHFAILQLAMKGQ